MPEMKVNLTAQIGGAYLTLEYKADDLAQAIADAQALGAASADWQKSTQEAPRSYLDSIESLTKAADAQALGAASADWQKSTQEAPRSYLGSIESLTKAADAANAKANPKGGEHKSSDEARAASQEQSRAASALAAAKKSQAASSEPTKPSSTASASTTESSSPAATQSEFATPLPEAGSDLPKSEFYTKEIRPRVLAINAKFDKEGAAGDGRKAVMAVLARFGLTKNATELTLEQFEPFASYAQKVLDGAIDPSEGEVA